MTHRWLSIWIYLTLAIYTFALVLGITLKLKFPEANPAYAIFKDLIPFVIAIPAAWFRLLLFSKNFLFTASPGSMASD